MKKVAMPNVLVSKCLGFDSCRYNGQSITDEFIEKLRPYVNFIPVCAEVEIGLGVPRFPIRIVDGKNGVRLVQPKTELDVTDKMNKFAEGFLSSLKDIDGVILKERSPSCGIKGVKTYHDNGMSAGSHGVGLFAGAVIDRFKGLALDDEGRLKNFKLREHFLTKLFALAEFRELSSSPRMKTLTEFHAKNKFLLMAYSEKEMRLLGKIAANPEKRAVGDVFKDYGTHLRLALASPPKRTATINALQHIVGFFKGSISANEKQFFAETLGLYRDERIPLSSVLSTLKVWVVRDANEYLLGQSIFSPFPPLLIELKDSGRKLEL